ncbi:hypothetical protein [Pelagibius sp. Alg239-R121]|uniref:hypothetical protein n=1 Tax=Pelagibius sp. Alg239-R121 TaxID=2993448 RepID=UPI0024A714D7|nr:hypothetical protein [Pelagibius sp. Alg239-R121]
MNYSIFAVYEGATAQSSVLADCFRETSARWAENQPRDLSLDLFLPEPAPVLLFDDGPGPAAILEISCQKLATLERLIAEDSFGCQFVRRPAELLPGLAVTFGAFRSLTTPVAGAEVAHPRRAKLSFIVRYYGPMPDETAFQNFYTTNHPPILAQFPDIRNVCCYLPEKLQNFELPASEILLINEVVFDDLAGLNMALASDVIPLLKADSARFPPFGHSTHHAMRREELVDKPRE